MSCSLQNQIIVERMREVFQKTKWKFLMEFSIKRRISLKISIFFLILPKPIEEQMISSSSQPAKEK